MRDERMDEVLLARYLLGSLPEDEQVRVEDRAFSDVEYRSALEAVEADLIDSYVRGEMPKDDRANFERRFLVSPGRRKKVEFARNFARLIAESKVDPIALPKRRLWSGLLNWNPAMQWVATAAMLLCVVGLPWLIVQNASMRSELALGESKRRSLERQTQELQQKLDQQQRSAVVSPGPTAAPVLASLVLVPGLSRAESRTPRLTLHSTDQLAHIEIQLEPRDEYSRFRAELRTKAGAEILARGNLSRQRSGDAFSVAFDVPASALAAGEYELALQGLPAGKSPEAIGYYYFSVEKP